MKFPDFKDKKVLIMGLGLLGRGINDAKFFAEKGAKVTVTDLKTEKELEPSLKELDKYPITFILGEHRQKDFKNQNLIIKGAGVSSDSIYLKIARENKIPIEMDESLFAKYCPCPIIGVTGTRGKTTTTMLIYEILKKARKKVFIGGNIQGLATLPLIDQVDQESLVVLELSSWQLQGFAEAKISPSYAVFTNIYPDHLDKYQDMEEYIDDKKVIFNNQKATDYLFLNSEDPLVSKFYLVAKAKIIWFSQADVTRDYQVNLLGAHNLSNIAAAIKVASILKIDNQTIKAAIAEFKGVPGRLELIKEINKIKFINDTTSTTPIATEMALEAFKGQSIVLITGGADKNLSYDHLATRVVGLVKKIIFLEGSATAKLKKSLTDAGLTKEQEAGNYDDLAAAVKQALAVATFGDIILFSPAATSFGMFKNEYDRGEKFIEAVNKLK